MIFLASAQYKLGNYSERTKGLSRSPDPAAFRKVEGGGIYREEGTMGLWKSDVGEERMSIFREYDIRGIVPGELNEEMVTKIGYALAGKIPGEYVAVGYDARRHAPTLFGWLAAGLAAGGKTLLDMGMVPTPVNYFAH